jgi:hypothetical protein
MNVRLQYNIGFTAGVHYKGQLIMNNYALRVFMITNTKDAENTNIAFERLKYFINEIDSTVIINQQDKDACQRYLDAGIKIVTMPNEPVDQIVGVMLFYKLNAIMEERITVVETELSSQLGENMVYLHSENENAEDIVFPDWWTTPDLLHYSTESSKGEKILSISSGTHTVWDELQLGWPSSLTGETGNNVVFADFTNDDTK